MCYTHPLSAFSSKHLERFLWISLKSLEFAMTVQQFTRYFCTDSFSSPPTPLMRGTKTLQVRSLENWKIQETRAFLISGTFGPISPELSALISSGLPGSQTEVSHIACYLMILTQCTGDLLHAMQVFCLQALAPNSKAYGSKGQQASSPL